VGDASHATHDDCQGHFDSMMSMGKGATISFSNKLKIATKSLTDSELLVGLDRPFIYLPHTIFHQSPGIFVRQKYFLSG
jgi:hypothetical protein